MERFNNLTRRSVSALFAVFILTILFTVVQAQTTAFTYQGRFTDSTVGQPTSGTYDFQFVLYDAGGTLIASNSTSTTAVTVTNGVFTASLDFGAAAFPGADRYLEIRVKKPVDAVYTPLTPRQRITSAPYAIRALNATNIETTGGNSVVSSINNAATNTTINSSRLSADVVKLNPGATQTATTMNSSAALLDVSGTTTDTNNNVLGTSRLRFNFDGGFFASGQRNFGSVPTTGAGVRMMWYPSKGAFRAGRVFLNNEDFGIIDGSTYWDDANIGVSSTAFGENNRALGRNSFAAGSNARAAGEGSFTFNGTASGLHSIALGSGAQATGEDSLALGPSSTAGGILSVVIGPSIANGNFAVAIGLQNRAYGDFSLALGKNASTCSTPYCDSGTQKQGAIVISDGCAVLSSDAVTASANNQVNIRGCGGFRFFTNQNLSAGVQLAPGGGSWSSISDRNMKENFLAVDKRDVLRRVLNLPISTWNYKSQDASIRHIGAMAQDFKAAFNVGESDKMIATIDPDGVAFAAIQGLNEELNEQLKERDRKIETLEGKLENQRMRIDVQNAQNELQQKQIDGQKKQIDEMKVIVCSLKPDAAVCAGLNN